MTIKSHNAIKEIREGYLKRYDEVAEIMDDSRNEQSPPYIWAIVFLASIAFWAVVVWFALS